MAQGSLLLLLFVSIFISSPLILEPAFAQTSLNVTASSPCFLNYTAQGIEMWQNCGMDTDYLSAVTIGFDWVTGGLWPIILVTVLIVMTYIKYQNGIYPFAIGVVFLPIAGAYFPDEFISYAVVIAAVIAAGAIIKMLIKQTTDYG